MNADYKNFIVEKCEMCLSNDSFSPDMYAKYDVKKGLRDSHGGRRSDDGLPGQRDETRQR